MTLASSFSAKLKRIEWTLLSSYLSLCHTNSPSASAEALGRARSSMSGRLRRFEEVMAIPLFERSHKKLYVNEQGLCLGKYILPLLILEHFARHYRHDLNEPAQWLEVSLPLNHYGGRISRALENAIHLCQQQYPNVLIWPQPYNSFDARHSQNLEWLPKWPRIGKVRVDWVQQPDFPASDSSNVSGHWCVLSHESLRLNGVLSAEQLAGIKLSLPRMPWELLQQVASLSKQLNLSVEHIGMDYRQILSRPNERKKAILINSLLLDEQIVASDWQVNLVDCLPEACIQLQSDAQHPVVQTFIGAFLQSFQPHCTNVSWLPQTQLKHWHYLHQTIRSGSISTAAQALYMSQSALSIQLKQLETSLGYRLLQRRMGVRKLMKTEVGEVFFELCQGLENTFACLFEYVDGQRLNQQQHLSLGVLPSIDTQSTLVHLIANQVDDWQRQHPEVCLEIVEERHRYLIDALRSHDLHLAIIEADSPWVSQVPIQKPEPMGLVICVDAIDSNIVELNWSDLNRFQLVLPRKGNGMRLIIDRHCLSLRIDIQPAIESDSLNINQYWISKGRYAAILPQSAVAQAIDQGLVRFIPLQPVLNRVLRLAYLSNRILNPVEANLLTFLLNQ